MADDRQLIGVAALIVLAIIGAIIVGLILTASGADGIAPGR